MDRITRAYSTRRIQVQGGSRWIDSDRFDIAAKSDNPENKMQPMVQSLLQDRFNLAIHRATMEVSVLALVVGKSADKRGHRERCQPDRQKNNGTGFGRNRGAVALGTRGEDERLRETAVVRRSRGRFEEPVIVEEGRIKAGVIGVVPTRQVCLHSRRDSKCSRIENVPDGVLQVDL